MCLHVKKLCKYIYTYSIKAVAAALASISHTPDGRDRTDAPSVISTQRHLSGLCIHANCELSDREHTGEGRRLRKGTGPPLLSSAEIGELHGTLSARGRFHGRLADIEGRATTETPYFAVSDGRPTKTSRSVQCTVNGLNSDVVLHTIEVRIGATTAHAGGSVRGDPKVTDLAGLPSTTATQTANCKNAGLAGPFSDAST